MNAFSLWNVGDEVLVWGANVLLQVTLITAVTLAIAVMIRRSSAVRYWVLCCALFLILLSPVVSHVMRLSGKSFLTVSLVQETLVRVNNRPALEPSIELQPLETIPLRSISEEIAETPLRIHEVNEEMMVPFTLDSLKERTELAEEEPLETVVTTELPSTELAATPEATAIETFVTRQTETMLGKVLRYAMPPILIVWLTGSFFLLIRLVIAWGRLASILRTAKPSSNKKLIESFERVQQLLQIKRMPELVLSKQVLTPLATGIFRPRVVLPERIISQVSSEQLQDILIHETAHIVRRDQMVVLLQNIASAVFWIQPLLKILNRQLAQSREEVCDNYALAATDAPSYSRTLLTLAELAQGRRPIVGAVGLFTSSWKLERRVAGLLDEHRSRKTRITTKGMFFVISFSLVMAMTVTLGTISLAVEKIDKLDSTTDIDHSKSEKNTSKVVDDANRLEKQDTLHELERIEHAAEIAALKANSRVSPDVYTTPFEIYRDPFRPIYLRKYQLLRPKKQWTRRQFTEVMDGNIVLKDGVNGDVFTNVEVTIPSSWYNSVASKRGTEKESKPKPSTQKPLAEENLNATDNRKIYWGEAKDGLRLGIRSAKSAKREVQLRHGDWLRYEVWVKNENDEAIHIPRDLNAMIGPALNDTKINLLSSKGMTTRNIPKEVRDKAVLTLPPGGSSLLHQRQSYNAPIRPAGIKRDKNNIFSIYLAPGRYPILAEQNLFFFKGGKRDRFRRDGKVVQLESATREIQVLPAARLQVRRTTKLSAELTREAVSENANFKILNQESEDGKKREIIYYRNTEVLLDEEDIISVSAKANEGFESIYTIYLELTPKASERFGRETVRLTDRKATPVIAILLDGKVLSAPKLMSPITGGKIAISGNFSKDEAGKLVQDLLAANAKIENKSPRESSTNNAKQQAPDTQKILWGEAVDGLRLGIRPAVVAKRAYKLRHGDWLRHEVWIKNETGQVIYIPRDPSMIIRPRLEDKVINLVGSISIHGFAIPIEEFEKAVLTLLPGDSALLLLGQSAQSPVRSPQAQAGRYGPASLNLAIGRYPLTANKEIYYLQGGRNDRKRRDGKSVQLQSATAELEILPAAHLQVREANEPSTTQQEYERDPSVEILDWPSEDEKNRQLVIYKNIEVLLDEDDVISAEAKADKGVESRYSIFVELSSTATKRFARETVRMSQRKTKPHLAILLDGKILSAPKLKEPITGGKIAVTGNFTKEEAEKLVKMLSQKSEIDGEKSDKGDTTTSIENETGDKTRENVTASFSMDAIRLAMSGRNLTAGELKTLEEKVKTNPADVISRTKLLGYYFGKRTRNQSAREAKRRHVLWLIRNVPESGILDTPYGGISLSDAEGFIQGKTAWLDQIKKQPNNIKLLDHAENYFIISERKLAEELLLKAQSLDGSNPKWANRLGHLYSLNMNSNSLKEKNNAAFKALEQYELAYKLSTERGRDIILKSLEKVATKAGMLEKAEEYAKGVVTGVLPKLEVALETEEKKKTAKAKPAIDVSRHIMSGFSLKAEDVKSIEKTLEKTPQNIILRTKLISYYSRKQYKDRSARKAKRRHVLWLIQNYPEANILAHSEARLDAILNPIAYLQGMSAWIDQLKKQPDNLKLIEHASGYFLQHDRKRAIALLKKAISLDKDNPKWHQSLGQMYSLEMNSTLSRKFKKETATKSLEHYEIAYKLSTERGRDVILQYLAKVALAAEQSDKAKKYAEEMLSRKSSDWNSGNKIHHGHITLGKIAFSNDKIEEAKKHLLEAGKTTGSPQLNSFGPNMSLAKDLLKKGENDVVLQYFELCSKFWKSGEKKLKAWTAVVKNGKIPDFGSSLNH